MPSLGAVCARGSEWRDGGVGKWAMLLRTLIGLVLGIFLFLIGIPVLQGLVRPFYHPFSFQDAVLALIMIFLCVITCQLTALQRPARKD